MKLFLLFFLTLCLSGCASMEKTEQTGNFGYERNENFIISEADLEVAVNNPKEIVLDKEQQVYIIDSAGDYFLKGECEGQIQIDVQDQVVHLILEDVKMQSKNGPAIYVKSAAKVVITIPEKTSSVIMDSTNYRGYEDARACIYGEDDITINGEGRLQVYGYCKDAMLRVCKLDLYNDDNILGINMMLEGDINDSFKVSVPGKFSSYNAMCAIMISSILGIDISYIKNALS